MVETFDEKRYNYILEKMCNVFGVHFSYRRGGEIVEDFEKVYSLYYPDVFKYLLSLSNNSDIAQELTQETFFLALKSFKNFRGDCKIRVWLCQIAKHSYYAYLKKLKKTVSLDDPDILGKTEGWARVTFHRSKLKIIEKMEEKYENSM